MDVDDIEELAAFDGWANGRLFDAAAALTPEQRTRRVTSSFSSLEDTLAHILAEEWIWLRRCQGEDPREVDFRSLEGHPRRQSVRDMLVHVVSHSTYHRGQAATILRQLGAAAPETDFVVFREAVRESAHEPPVLVLPGLHDSGPKHWQSQWEALHLGFRRVV